MFSSESSSQGVLYLSTKLSLATMLDRKPTLIFFFSSSSSAAVPSNVCGRQKKKKIAALSSAPSGSVCMKAMISKEYLNAGILASPTLQKVEVTVAECLFAM